MTDTELTGLLASYRPSDAVIDLVRRANLVLLVGISGAGKDTLKHRLLERPQYYNFISHTTRMPRSNKGIMEKDGEDYHFITIDDALRMLKAGEYIEAKQYSANVYGTTAEGLRASLDGDKVALNDVEVQGVDEYARMSDNVLCIFVLPPSYDEWMRRLTGRYADGEIDSEDIERRLATAKIELELALSRSYYKFVINDTLDATVERVDKIVSNTYSVNDQSAAIACAKKLLEDIGTR